MFESMEHVLLNAKNQAACTGATGRNQAAILFESWFLDFVVAFKGNVGR